MNTLNIDINKTENLLAKIKNFYSNKIDLAKKEIDRLLKNSREESKKITKMRKKYGINQQPGFNIFEVISDQYQKENLHSNILKTILDPQTKEIGNIVFLNKFVDLLNKKADLNILHFSENDDIQIEREKRNIDLLIHYNKNNEKRAIIIENKINDAEDQPDQLPRHAKYVIDERMKIEAVVYLTKTRDKKPPNKTAYSEEYRGFYQEEVLKGNKEIHISVIDQNKIDLSHFFLDACIKETQEKTTEVFLEQYNNLLKHLGGREMTKELDRELLLKLCEKDNIEGFQNIGNIWEKRNAIVEAMLFPELEKRLNDYKLKGVILIKKIDEKHEIRFGRDDGGYHFSIMKLSGDLSGIEKERYQSIFKCPFFNNTRFKEIDYNQREFWRYVDAEHIASHHENLFEWVFTGLKKIEELYKNEKTSS